jgi:hypothetical protein
MHKIKLKTLLCTLAVSLHALADAADTLPPYLTGTWTSEKSPFAGGTRQFDMYLEAEGAGVFIGTRAPIDDLDSADDKPSDQRIVLGMPITTTLKDDTLQARLFAPGEPGKMDAAVAARMTLTCHYRAVSITLTCADPNGVTFPMQRHSETMTAKVAAVRAAMRAQSSAR